MQFSFSLIIIVALGFSLYWIYKFSIDTLPYLNNPTQLAKDVIKELWEEGRTHSGYEVVNYQRYVYYFLEYIAGFVIVNIPQRWLKKKFIGNYKNLTP